MFSFFDGRSVLYELIRRMTNEPLAHIDEIYIALHRDDSDYYKAAEVSAREKGQAFGYLGIPVRFIQSFDLINPGVTQSLRALARPPLFVFQKPFPEHIITHLRHQVDLVDLDQVTTDVSFSGSSAVTEAATRLLFPLKQLAPLIVVVGGRGRFGSQIVRLAEGLGLDVRVVDQGDDTSLISSADVVVSAVGKPHLIGPELIGERVKFLIDVGFNVVEGTPRAYRGDIDPRCYKLATLVTPVPGGVGPLQVATLIERAAFASSGQPLTYRWTIENQLAPLFLASGRE